MTRNPARATATALNPKAKKRMFWRMMRTVCRARRIVSGSAGSGSPRSTTEPASAARSPPTPGKREPDVRPRQGRGVVDAVAHHGHDRGRHGASARSTRPWRPGVSSNSTCLIWTFFATARAGAARSPVRIARSLSPRCFRSWITSCAAAPDPVAGTDHAQNLAVAHQDRARSAPTRSRASIARSSSAEIATPCSRTRRRLPTRSVSGEPGRHRARQASIGQDPGPRLGLKVVDLGQGEPAAARLGDQQPRQRVLAGLLGRGGQAEHFVLAFVDISASRARARMQSPSSGLPSVRVPVLSKAIVLTRASPSMAAPP